MWDTGEAEQRAIDRDIQAAKEKEYEKYYGKQKRGTNMTPKKRSVKNVTSNLCNTNS